MRRGRVEAATTVDKRKEYMMLLIVLSRVAIQACEPFLEGVPADAMQDADHPWWYGEERDIYMEAMVATIDELQG
jgi:hypothetical protein